MAKNSPGTLFAERQRLEEEYEDELVDEVETFLTSVEKQSRKGIITGVTVFALWAAFLVNLEKKKTSPTLMSLLKDSKLPELVLRSTAEALAVAAGQAMSAEATALAVQEALGLRGDKIGQLKSSEGASSWTGDSKMAARTAATADSGNEMLRLGAQEGYTHKRWHTRFDERVRESHRIADGQTVLLNDVFHVGDSTMQYPGDPMADVFADIVNCRCVITLVSFGDRPLDLVGEPWNNPRS